MIRNSEIRHHRIVDLRRKITNGWTIEQLREFCKNRLDVSTPTITSYIDEAAAPYREKYQKQKEKYGNE